MSVPTISPGLPTDVNKITDTDLLGKQAWFEDLDYSATTPLKTPLSGMLIECYLVRNETNGNLTAGTAVKWDTGSTYGPGKAVSAKAGADEDPDGIVFGYVTGNIADGETFWMVKKGPTRVQYDGSANLAIGDRLITAATGYVAELNEGTDDEGSRIGVALEAKSSGSAGDLIRALVDIDWN